MQTPVWSSAPLPPGPLRTVDLFPAMLSWLGVELPPVVDGAAPWVPEPQRAPIADRRDGRLGAELGLSGPAR